MLFKLPYSWLKEYVAVPDDPHDLARELSLHGVSVERVVAVRHEFTKVAVGQITAIRPHPNAGKLQLATVTVGTGSSLEIVCGASNIQVGQKVPVALVGAKLPPGVTIARREVRGITSNGMLCSARELGIHEDQAGILVLHPADRLGAALTDLGQSHDFLLEVEPTTNRSDLASVIGVAREVAAMTGKKLRGNSPQPLPLSKKSPLRIVVEDKRGCPRVCAVRVEGVTVGSSPWWMQERLVRAGIRPINSIVDITNYVMLELGQPMHAYDADLVGPTLTVRRAKSGESMVALNGRTYALTRDHLITRGENGPADIAGVMGGEATGVTAKTVNVVLKAAAWNPVLVRKMSRQLALSSEASRLFEKGLSTESPPLAVARAAALAEQLAGGRVRGGLVDIRSRPYRPVVVRFPFHEAQRLLGVTLPRATVTGLLRRLGFSVVGAAAVAKVTVPYWREHDVVGAEDVVEEVARLYGYHRFPSELPPAVPRRRADDVVFAAEDRASSLLEAAGFTETMSYSFIPERWLEALGYPASAALKIANPLSSDFAYLRPSLLPSLAAVVAVNQPHHGEQSIFELAATYLPGTPRGSSLDRYRREPRRLAGIVVRPAETTEELFRSVKGVVAALLGAVPEPRAGQSEAPPPPFSAGLSVAWGVGERRVAFGVLAPSFLSRFGVAARAAAFDIPVDCLVDSRRQAFYQPVPRFPSAKRDVALVVDRAVRYTDLERTMRAAAPLLRDVTLFDIYRSEQLGPSAIGYAVHLTYRADDRTLSSAEVETQQQRLLDRLSTEFGATVRH